MSPAVPIVSALLDSDDPEVLADAAWALSYLSDGSDDHIQVVVEAGVVERLIPLLAHDDDAVRTPALRTIGNIATGATSGRGHESCSKVNPIVSFGVFFNLLGRRVLCCGRHRRADSSTY